VSYEKKWQSQRETSRRLLYPMVGGTWAAGVTGLAVLLLLNLPSALVISGLFAGWSRFQSLGLLYLLLFAVLYTRYTYAIWGKNWWLGALVWPVVILQELLLFIESLVGYGRGTITWKGRPVLSPRLVKQAAPLATNDQ
jgi:Zn-dependent protease with chaperone function